MVGFWKRKQPDVVVEEELVDLVPAASLFARPASPPPLLFTPGELIPPLWRVGPGGSVDAVSVRFLPDGRVLGIEGLGTAGWELGAGHLTVRTDGEAFWIFDRREMVHRREIVRGTTISGGEIEMLADLDDLRTAQSIRWPSRPIVVTFNSVAQPFNDQGTDWEFTECLSDDRFDFMLFSERAPPSFCYLNKTARVLDRLRIVPQLGYREFLFLGQGSGGFAALMFAELLSYEFHDCRFRSLTVNPMTAHGKDIEDEIRQVADESVRAPFLDADAVSQKDCAVASVRELVRMSTRRRGGDVEHRILFDQDNPAQAMYAYWVSDLDGFSLCPTALGMRPDQGSAAIIGSEAFAAGLAWGREQ